MSRGVFITLEGGEGAGKSTHLRLLAEGLRARGLDVVTTREPGGSPGAEQIRALLVSGEPDRWDKVTEALLLSAARRDHVTRLIEPALARGAWVLCDRFSDSTLAYQGFGHGADPAMIATLTAMATSGLVPDLTLILDLPVEAGLARAAGRGGDDRFERMGTAFHERLRHGFLTIAASEPGRCVVIDAVQPLDSVQAAIRAAVESRWP